MPLISAIRDKAIEMAVRNQIQKKTGAIKNVNDLEINAGAKTFSLKLQLAGETEPLAVSGSYRLSLKDGKTMLAPADIQTSKEWLTILAGELLKGRSFEVPGMVRSFL